MSKLQSNVSFRCQGGIPGGRSGTNLGCRVSAASFRFRYLLGLLFHVAIGLYGCASHAFVTNAVSPPILGSCGEKPSFADATQLKRWTSFPVEVSIDAGAIPEELRETYRDGIARGIGLWSELTGGRIGDFAIRYDGRDAPVKISITGDPLPDRAMGTTELTFTGNLIGSARVRLARSRMGRPSRAPSHQARDVTPVLPPRDLVFAFAAGELRKDGRRAVGRHVGVQVHEPGSQLGMFALEHAAQAPECPGDGVERATFTTHCLATARDQPQTVAWCQIEGREALTE